MSPLRKDTPKVIPKDMSDMENQVVMFVIISNNFWRVLNKSINVADFTSFTIKLKSSVDAFIVLGCSLSDS